jgi:hypothetical protein
LNFDEKVKKKKTFSRLEIHKIRTPPQPAPVQDPYVVQGYNYIASFFADDGKESFDRAGQLLGR